MEKSLEYYANLPYKIIVSIEEDNDGGPCYVARYLELPHCLGVGKTLAEAIKELELHKRIKIKTHLEEGFNIPEPQTTYSGNINIRVDPVLHARLAQEAAVYDMSLNKYASLILERRQLAAPVRNIPVVRERKSRYSTKKKST
jgi:predicted HicB family RNase H-like nuclease